MKHIFAFGLGLIGSVYAQTPPDVSNGGILPGPTQNTGDEGIVFVRDTLGPAITNGWLWITLALSTAMFVIAGIMYVLSNGEEEMVKKAKDTIMWAVIGVVVSILSLAIVQIIVGLNFG